MIFLPDLSTSAHIYDRLTDQKSWIFEKSKNLAKYQVNFEDLVTILIKMLMCEADFLD